MRNKLLISTAALLAGVALASAQGMQGGGEQRGGAAQGQQSQSSPSQGQSQQGPQEKQKQQGQSQRGQKERPRARHLGVSENRERRVSAIRERSRIAASKVNPSSVARDSSSGIRPRARANGSKASRL